MFVCVELGIVWTFLALCYLHVEDGSGLLAFDAFGVIKEGEIEWTVGDVVVQSASLIVLLNYVLDGLFA